MPARDLPNLGLRAFFSPGENGWGPDMSRNMLLLSVLTQGVVLEKVAVLPASPDNGDVYLVDETNADAPNAVAIRDAGAWVYAEPSDGWLLFNQAEGYYERFDGTAWSELETGGGGGGTAVSTNIAGASTTLDADQVGQYLRFTSAAAKTLTIPLDATEPMPANGEWHVRNVGASNLTIVATPGVTINPPNDGSLLVPQGGTVTLKRVGVNEFDLLGQTVTL